MTERGVRHHARRLVDGEQVLVFVEHDERDVLGRHRPSRRRLAVRGNRDGDGVAVGRAGRHATDRHAVDRDVTALDPRLNARAGGGRNVGEVPAEDEIDPPAGVAAIGNECAGRHDPLS